MSVMNTYVQRERTYGGGKTIWYSIDEKYPVGGSISVEGYKPGDLVPAGSMVAISTLGGKAEIVKSTDTEKLSKVVGLTESDIFVPEGVVAITTAIVTKGQIEGNPLTDVPAEARAKMPGITFVDRIEKEGELDNE